MTPYTLAGHSSTFEFGGRFRNEHKFVNQDTLNYTPNLDLIVDGKVKPVEDPSLVLTNFLNDFSDPNYYGGAYQFGAGVDYRKVTAFAAQTVTSSVIGNAFNQIEKVSAGYVMNTVNLGRFRLVTGLRIEATGENNLGRLGVKRSTDVGTTPIRVTNSYIDLLPSASLRYALTPSSGLRLVYGRGLSRPNFGDLIPFQSAPSGGTARNTVSQGNPRLKSEYADNIDLLYENSLPGTGLLQAGFFYKNLSNPIVSTQLCTHPTPLLLVTTTRIS